MNPLLWLNAVAIPLFLAAAWLFRDHEGLALLLILGSLGIPTYTLWEFRYFARRDPQRLQSEEYLLAHQRLMIQSKSVSIPVDAAAIPVGSNPELDGSLSGRTMPVSSDGPAGALPLQETDDEE